MLSFFTYLKYLISGDTGNLAKAKELTKLFKTFKHSKYKFITKEKKLTNLFLQKIYSLDNDVNDFKGILESTLFSKDENKAMLYLNHYIEANLPDEIKNKKERFIKEVMWERVMESENASQTLKEIEEDFNMYKNFLSKERLPRVESEYYLLYKLNMLATFNFELFFSKFQADYNGVGVPVYTPVNGEDLLNDIKDLYFLIASLPPKTDLTSSLTKIFAFKNEDAKTMAKKAISSINDIYKMISDELSPQILLTLCRFISEDIKLRITVEQKFFSILDKYRKELDSRFQKNKNFIQEKYSEKSLQQDIYSLFKGKQLLKIEGFTEELAKLLHENNFDSISGIQALKITKTFIIELYEPVIRDIVNTLILEGFFSEKEYQKEFSNVFFAANELKNFITEFENTLSESGKNSFFNLNSMLKSYKGSSTGGENKILTLIESINQKIKSSTEKCSEIFYKLGSQIYLFIQDYKNPKPVRLVNIKTIKGSQNKDFISQLASSYNDLAKFIKIIKNFITVEKEQK